MIRTSQHSDLNRPIIEMTDKTQESDEDIFIGPKAKKEMEEGVQKKVALVQRQPKAPFWKQNEEEPPKEKQMSEAEMQLKNMLQKQLETKITLESELAKKKQFQQSALFKDDQERRSGAQTLESFKQSIIDQQQLRENMATPGTSQHISSGPQKRMDGTTKVHEHSHRSDGSFSNAKEMSRHEIEIEQSLYRGTKKADELKHLIKAKAQEYADDDPVMKTLKEYEAMQARKRRNVNKQSTRQLALNGGEISEDDEDVQEFIGPILAPLHRRVKPLDEVEVQRNRLTIEEIKSIKKFSNYDPGIPNKKLYLKNLSRNITKEDLASLFVRFESMDAPSMEYKVLGGRMRGQAFITFADEVKARKALEFANGYILNGNPIIISFGRDKKSS